MFQQYYSEDSPETLLAKPGILSVVTFNTDCAPPATPGIIPVGLDALDVHGCEVIACDQNDITRGVQGDCYWSASEEVLCASIWISPEDCQDIESATFRAYSEILSLLHNKGYPHPFRFWNYIPNINVGPGDREEYKKFCTGRLNAFTEQHIECEQFPAASALGHHAKGAVIYVLAGKTPGKHYENPKQEKAYCYPRQYGPSSPSFSRATEITVHGQDTVFISGTASILGHETKCPGDIHEQLAITVSNIHHLSLHINESPGKLFAIRVYLRHKHDLEEAKRFLSNEYPESDIIYTYADICRSNLLVEIEAAFPLETNTPKTSP